MRPATVTADMVLDGLEEVHGAMLRAGLAHVAGDQAAALVELEDARLTLDDAIADLQRVTVDEDTEPEPTRKRSQLTTLPGTEFEDIFTEEPG